MLARLPCPDQAAPPQPVQIFRVQPGTGPGHILLKRSQANVTRLQTKTVAFDIISVDTKLSSKYSLVLRGPLINIFSVSSTLDVC